MTSVLVSLMLYMAFMVFGFCGVYSAIDFHKHFNVEEKDDTALTRLYYSLGVQATVMTEIAPKTPLGRRLVMLQILSAWLPTLFLVVPWIKAARRRG